MPIFNVKFDDTFDSANSPVIGDITVSNVITYVDETDYDTNESNSADGSFFYESSTHTLKYRRDGAWVALVDLNKIQTLTNKTISASTNTIDVSAALNIAATELNAALEELEGRITSNDTDITTLFSITTDHETRILALEATEAETVKVSANDTTDGYLEDKVVAGTDISVATLNDGGNETLEIINTAPDTGEVFVSANDTTKNYLFNKLVAGTNVTLTEQNDGGNETILIDSTGGGGGAAGSIDNILVDDSTAEDGVGNYDTYKDAAQPEVEDGTGGVATLTVTQSAVDPLKELNSYLITKSAANLQGEGVSIDFTVPREARTNPLKLSFSYETSAGYNDGDIRLYFYDITNSKVIPVNPRDLPALGNPGIYSTYVQVPADSTSMRLIFHVASTNASSYTIKYDTVKLELGNTTKVSRTLVARGYQNGVANHTSPGNFQKVPLDSTTFDNNSAIDLVNNRLVATESGYYFVNAEAHFDNNANGARNLRIYKNGSVYASGPTINATADGNAEGCTVSALVYLNKDDYVEMFAFQNSGGALSYISSGGGQFNYLEMHKVGTDAAGATGNIITAKKVLTANVSHATSGSYQTISWNGEEYDTTNSFGTTAFVFPESGYYRLNAIVNFAANGTGFRNVRWNLDSGTKFYVGDIVGAVSGADTVLSHCEEDYFEKGQSITVEALQNSGGPLNMELNFTTASVTKINAGYIHPSHAHIGCSYSDSAGQTFTDATYEAVKYSAINYDSHAAYNTTTGIYTVPAAGKYDVYGCMVTTSVGWTSGDVHFMAVYVNGSRVGIEQERYRSAFTDQSFSRILHQVDVSKGDTIEVRAFINRGASTPISTALPENNRILITKIG